MTATSLMAADVLERPATAAAGKTSRGIIGQIFRDHGPKYLALYGERLPPQHAKALGDIAHCRTEALGGHVEQCSACGYERYSYHSCGNSSCPACSGERRAEWAESRIDELLPVTYFHVVFTLPEELRGLARANQKTVYNALLRSGAAALQKLCRDPKFIGGDIGAMGVLHTWTQTLDYHPHAHFVVPGGGLERGGGCWLPSRNTFLVPLKPLALLFRGIFKSQLRRAGLLNQTDPAVWSMDWVVYSKPSVSCPDNVIKYLAAYVFRAGISENRIASYTGTAVTFHYTDRKTGKRLKMTLPVLEFIRRFLQHTLPFKFVKVRYFGIWSTCRRHDLLLARHHILQQHPELDPELNGALVPELANAPAPALTSGFVPIDRKICPACKHGRMTVLHEIPRMKRRPFW